MAALPEKAGLAGANILCLFIRLGVDLEKPLWLSQSLLLNISIGIVYNVQTVLTRIVRH